MRIIHKENFNNQDNVLLNQLKDYIKIFQFKNNNNIIKDCNIQKN